MLAATWFTAIATSILAIFAIVTAWYARKAFREQSEEVHTLKAQLKDQEDLNTKQTPVLELQAKELQESIEERRRDREENERRQATQVAAWMIVERHRDDERAEVDVSDPSLDVLDPSYDPRGVHVYAIVQNASDQPVWDVTIHVPGFVPKSANSNELKPTYFEDERVVIGPRETIKTPLEGYTLSYNRLPIEIDFRDNAGGEWRRDDRGRLHIGRQSPASWAWIDELAAEKKRNDQ